MKRIILSHRTALEAIREYRNDPENLRICQVVNNMKNNKTNPYKYKIDVMARNKNNTRSSKKYKYHIAPYWLKDNNLINIGENVFCVKPEIVITQLANELSFEKLFILMAELCGKYSLDNINSKFINPVEPITSIEKINRFLIKTKQIQRRYAGLNKASYVLKYCDNNSASPMESRLYLKFCGPRKLGFYEIKNLKLNVPIKLNKSSQLIANQKTITPDISNEDYKIAIEYDSAQYHENTIQGQKDKRRRDALVHEGWKVHTIVPSLINDPNSFHVIAKEIINELGQNSRIRNKDFYQRRNEMFNKLA